MDAPDTDCLFADIACYLRQDACLRAGREYWTEHPCITAQEVAMLQVLTQGPLCPETLAGILGRDCASTQQLLDGMVSVGVLERRGTQYANTDAATLYCRLYLSA